MDELLRAPADVRLRDIDTRSTPGFDGDKADGERALSTPLTRYYAEQGTPPGCWMGGGLAGHLSGDLGGGHGGTLGGRLA